MEPCADPTELWRNVQMWEKLTPDDIAQVRHKLSLRRAETLGRHAAELKTLDTQQEEIEKFEALVAEFTEKYLHVVKDQSAEALTTTEPAGLPPEGVAAQDAGEPETPEVPPRLRVEHRVSQNFGIPLRAARGF
jgi:hypothetical protein